MGSGRKPKDFSCAECMNMHRYAVEILEFGVVIFGNKAVIKKSNGDLLTVPIGSLKIERQTKEKFN